MLPQLCQNLLLNHILLKRAKIEKRNLCDLKEIRVGSSGTRDLVGSLLPLSES